MLAGLNLPKARRPMQPQGTDDAGEIAPRARTGGNEIQGCTLFQIQWFEFTKLISSREGVGQVTVCRALGTAAEMPRSCVGSKLIGIVGTQGFKV